MFCDSESETYFCSQPGQRADRRLPRGLVELVADVGGGRVVERDHRRDRVPETRDITEPREEPDRRSATWTTRTPALGLRHEVAPVNCVRIMNAAPASAFWIATLGTMFHVPWNRLGRSIPVFQSRLVLNVSAKISLVAIAVVAPVHRGRTVHDVLLREIVQLVRELKRVPPGEAEDLDRSVERRRRRPLVAGHRGAIDRCLAG